MTAHDIDEPLVPLGPVQWTSEAACRDADPRDFDVPEGTPEARAACESCPVLDDCLEYLLSWPTQVGFGAGLTEAQRITLRRRQGVQATHPWRRVR